MLDWPLWVVRLYAEFFEREPHPDDRREVLLAELVARYSAVHRGPGAAAPRAADFLPTDAWRAPESDGRYSDVDREMMRQLQRG